MLTKSPLKTRLHDCDRRIMLNHAKQEAIVFERDGSRDSAVLMLALRADMGRLQSERAEIQFEVIAVRNLLLHPTAMA